MGGYGSGPTRCPKTAAEDTLTLSIFDLKRLGVLGKDSRTAGSLSWSSGSSISYSAMVYSAGYPNIRLDFSCRGKSITQEIQLTQTTLASGGKRWWFLCPVTFERVGKLHFAGSPPRFACRKAHNLTYRSCQESRRFDRLHAAIAAQLGTTLADVKRTLKG
ncbi:hypothetical protein [Pelagibius sp. Alg239-R121]|uniref:hypothetical protein n=1 Tax=Pelagibius sp. Alg239-R121 TaxID=2993448 RepID=UPI0024A6D254|nr:hypothetical protein [Pelagibius sp. Alg239-R121]